LKENRYEGCIKILVSVIITVYNKEKYLDSCIKSIVNQDYRELEIIIIDDGSNDKSTEIINNWIPMDNRIKLYSQKNSGVSISRNNGIKKAHGEYILFVDGDDMLENNAINKLVITALKTKSDIIVSNFIYKQNSGTIKNNTIGNYIINEKNIFRTQTKYDMFFSNGRPMASACNKLYNLKFLKDINVLFEENIISEDRLFNLKCYLNNPKISIIDEYTYICNVIENSRSRSINMNFFNDSINLYYSFYEYLIFKEKMDIHKDLLQLTLINDIEKIYIYAYKFANKRLIISKCTKRLRKNKEIVEIIRSVLVEKSLKKTKGRKKYIISAFCFLFLHSPNIILTLFILLYMNLLKINSKIKTNKRL
jgi:glycosyltransferase involved in cell wall biosynthesis